MKVTRRSRDAQAIQPVASRSGPRAALTVARLEKHDVGIAREKEDNVLAAWKAATAKK
jgi:hypothetical protein